MQPRKLVRDQKNIQILEARSSKLVVWDNLGTHSFSPQPNLKISTIFQNRNFARICAIPAKFEENKKCSRASLNETRHYNLNIFCSVLRDLDFYARVLHNATAER